jgi:branched-chain amino acid transport system permease protein
VVSVPSIGALQGGVFYYLGLAIIFLPFLRSRVWLIAPLVIGGWLLRRCAENMAAVPSLNVKRERIARFARRSSLPIIAILFAAAAIAPFMASGYVTDILTSVVLYSILATALNITVGLSGVLVLGFIGFYAIGAYTTALLTAKFALCGFWIALPLSGLCAMLFGLALGAPALRLKGDYLAVVTLGFGEIVRIFANNLDSFTGGPNGILGIPRPVIFGFSLISPVAFYLFVLTCLAATLLIVTRIIRSRYGRAWIAVRENEMAAAAIGIDVFRKHLLSFALSAFFGGIAGSLFAVKQGFISPDSFTFFESVLVLCMVVLGGIGNPAGAVAGAFLLVAAPEFLRDFQLYRMLVFGAVMVAFMVFRPNGIMGSLTFALEVDDAKEEGEGLP